ncbi:hypothetical protein ACHWQZ_G018242 [Mnemiopsis leidyi]
MESDSENGDLLTRYEALKGENTLLQVDNSMLKMKVKGLESQVEQLKRASVDIQAQAEQEEEFISNTLMKTISKLKKDKEQLAKDYEQEEECLTNDLSRKLMQLRKEKRELEETLESEQLSQVQHLQKKILKLESEVVRKQEALIELRKEKIDLENHLEAEQEQFVNRLWKRMEQLENEKSVLIAKMGQDSTPPASPCHSTTRMEDNSLRTNNTDLVLRVKELQTEVQRLNRQLRLSNGGRARGDSEASNMSAEECRLREENLKLNRQLYWEREQRLKLSRALSESNSSLEMDEERHMNEQLSQGINPLTLSSPGNAYCVPMGARSPSPALRPHHFSRVRHLSEGSSNSGNGRTRTMSLQNNNAG